MARNRTRRPALASLTLFALLVGVPTASAEAAPRRPTATPAASTRPTDDGVRAGSVNATSMNLTAEYTATVGVNYGSRSFRVGETIALRNTSGQAIDRLELNTIAARL